MEDQSALSLRAPPGGSLALQAHQVSTNNGDFVQAGGNVNIHHNHITYPEPKLGISYILRLVDNLRSIHLDILSKATQGTGIWLLKTDKFILWLDPNGDLKIIWGTGLPGAGKSVMASLVINELEARASAAADGSICVCYVYFRYSDVALSIRDILEILVKQTIERHTDCASLAEETYARHLRENTQPTEAELLHLLQRFTGTKLATFYVLDALDEALDKLQLELVKKLTSLNVRLFITSRPLKGVEDCISGVHSLRIVAQAQDLELHINKGIDISSNLQGLLKKAGPLLRDEIVASIKQNCDGMFLHASLQLDALSECMSPGDVRRTLKAFPSAIEDVYLQTWNRILKRNPSRVSLAKAVLLWVLNASRSMTIEELELAVATSSETYEFDPDEVVPGSTLIAVCRGLVMFEEESRLVRLVHYTAKETLQELFRDSFPHPHSHLAIICMTHLKKCRFNNTMLGSEEELTTALQADPLLAYATAAWATHARQCLDVEDTRQQIATFIAESSAYPAIIQLESYRFFDVLRPFHIIAIHNLSISLITHDNASDPNATTHINQYTALTLASQLGHEDAVKAFLRLSKIQINLLNKGRSALMYAASLGHKGVARLLLTHFQIQVNLVDEGGWPALMYAAINGYKGIAALLLAHSEIQANLVDSEGNSALILAVIYHRTDIVTLLLAHHEIQVNLINNEGCSALMLAASWGRTDIVTLLLAHPDIQVNLFDTDGWSALMLAARYGYTDVVTLLLAHPEIQVNLVNNEGCSALMLAARDGRTDTVTLILARPSEIQVNLVDNWGYSALMLAADDSHTDIVTLLLARHEIQVNLINNEGCSTLMLAARYGRTNIVTLLLACPEIQVNLTKDYGYSALMLAVRYGRTNIVTLLLARPEIQINLVDLWGCSAIMLAVRYSRAGIVTLLLAHPEIQVDLSNYHGSTALLLAAQYGHKAVVELLLATGDVDVDAFDDDGNTAFKMAAAQGHESIVRLLLDVPNVNTTMRSTTDGHTAMSAAQANGHIGIVELLREFESRKAADVGPLGSPQSSLQDSPSEDGSDTDSSECYFDAEELSGEDVDEGEALV